MVGVMRYASYILPLVGAAAGVIVGSRRPRRKADLDPGAYVYGYPLDIEDDLSGMPHSLVDLESELLDEETFPGHQQH